MNKHFKDAWYYLRRSGSHLKRGVRTELNAGERKIRKWTGRERTAEPEPTRREAVRTNIRKAERRVKRRSRDAVKDARKRIRMS
ncbi:DUF7553 family protein [Haladaptatus sp. DFWS20]|uniref:DUF7553 family protein n=1 Tax=Haladaptatus sp. DFWS20 TaxID=3403467 RepID=UPI003EC067C6